MNGPCYIMSVRLSDDELEILSRPVRGSGGLQGLLLSLADSRSGRVQYLTDLQCERLVRYATKYGSGGFQDRLAPLVVKVSRLRHEVQKYAPRSSQATA